MLSFSIAIRPDHQEVRMPCFLLKVPVDILQLLVWSAWLRASPCRMRKLAYRVDKGVNRCIKKGEGIA